LVSSGAAWPGDAGFGVPLIGDAKKPGRSKVAGIGNYLDWANPQILFYPAHYLLDSATCEL
jgi:hypothetical protein